MTLNLPSLHTLKWLHFLESFNDIMEILKFCRSRSSSCIRPAQSCDVQAALSREAAPVLDQKRLVLLPLSWASRSTSCFSPRTHKHTAERWGEASCSQAVLPAVAADFSYFCFLLKRLSLPLHPTDIFHSCSTNTHTHRLAVCVCVCVCSSGAINPV